MRKTVNDVFRILTLQLIMSFNEQILSERLPFIFELLAQEVMSEALPPAIRYILQVIIDNFPFAYHPYVARYIDELCLLLEGVIQGFFVWKYNSSISESFYDLERASLNPFNKWKLLIANLAIPYLFSKMELVYSTLLDENDSFPFLVSSQLDLKQIGKFLMFKLIPHIFATWKASKFLFNLLYLFRKSIYYTPQNFLSGVYLVRKLENATINSSTKLFQVFGSLGLFVLKLIEWWYTTDRNRHAVNKLTSLPQPEPPSLTGINLDPYLCPLCNNERRNPTTIPCSGYVFCYVCIHKYITNYGKCPVTSLPVTHTQLIRLFPQT